MKPWERYQPSPAQDAGPWTRYKGQGAEAGAEAGAEVAPSTPAASSGVLDTVGQYAGLVGGGIAKGFAAAAGIPGDIERFVNSRLPAEYQVQGNPVGPLGIPTFLPTSAETIGAYNRLGLTGPEPQGAAQRMVSGTAQGVGGAIATLPFGGPLIGTLASGAGGGAAAAGAHELAPESRWLPIVAGMAGGATTGAFENWANNLLLGREAAATAQKAVEAGTNLESLQSVQKDLTNIIGRHNIEVSKLKEAANARSLDLINSAKAEAEAKIGPLNSQAEGTALNVGAKLASSSTLQEAGTEIQKDARTYINKELPAAQDAVGQKFFSLAPLDTPADVGHLAAAGHSIMGDLGPLSKAGQTIAPSKVPQFLKDIEGYAKGAAEGLVPQATLGNLKVLRTKIGEAIADPTIAPGMTRQQLEHLYAAATNDMGEVAAEKGPEAVDAFNQYNAEHTALFANRDLMEKVIKADTEGKETIAPEDAAKKLLASGKSGGTDLAKFRALLPNATDHLAAVALKTGRWGSLSPEARQALLPNDVVRQQVDAAFTARDAGVDSANAIRNQQIAAARQAKADLTARLNAQTRQLGLQKIDLREKITAAEKGHKEAQGTAAQAQAAYEGRPTVPTSNELIAHAMQHGLGKMGLSALYGEIGGQALGLGPQGSAALGAAFGLAPVLSKVLTPTVRRGAATGAVAGNPLGLPSNPAQ